MMGEFPPPSTMMSLLWKVKLLYQDRTLHLGEEQYFLMLLAIGNMKSQLSQEISLELIHRIIYLLTLALQVRLYIYTNAQSLKTSLKIHVFIYVLIYVGFTYLVL